MRPHNFVNFISTILILAGSGIAQAAHIIQTKGTKALIEFEDAEFEKMNVGVMLYAITSENKKIGLLEIKQVKGTRAICDILKGRAENGNSLIVKVAVTNAPTNQQPKAADEGAPKEEGTTSEETVPKLTSIRKKKAMGLLLGMANNSFAMDVGLTSSTTRYPGKLSGNSFNIKGFFDYDLSKAMTLRLASGMETLSATGTVTSPVCDNGTSTTCTVNFTYVAFEGSAHYNILQKSTRLWVGLGYSILAQVSSKTTIQNLTTSGGSNQVVLGGIGLDIPVGTRGFIPLVAEYGYFPGGGDVTASAMYLRGGYGFSF